MTAVDAASLGIAAWLAGFVLLLCGLIAWAERGISRWRAERDKENRRVEDGPKAIAAIVPAEDLANPPVHIERSPLVADRHRAEWALRRGEFAALYTQVLTSVEARKGPGRHRKVGRRSKRMDALLTTTRMISTAELFDKIAAEEGHPVREHGPVEPVRTETGDGWQQPALALRGLPPVVEDVLR